MNPFDNLFDLFSHIIWRPGIGDNIWWGWSTVALYYGTALLATLLYMQQRRTEKPDGRFYATLALLLLGLGIARQTGLLRWFTELGRAIAREEGWYTTRWLVQQQLVRDGLYGGFLLLLLLLWLNRHALRRQGIILLGVSFLLCFVAIRAISFHNIDFWLSRRHMGIPMNTLLEGGALLWIALSLCFAGGYCASLYPRRWLDRRRNFSSLRHDIERST